MHTFIHSLQEVGLTEKESRAYLALLELGKASAYAVAEKAGMKRPTTYVILTELMKKGLVLKTPHSKRQAFIAKSPDEFFKQQEEKLSQSKRILPQLLALSNPKKVRITYYEGVKEFNEAILAPLKDSSKEIVGFYAKAEKIHPEILKSFKTWRKRINEQGVTMRGITPDHPSLKEINKGLLEEGHILRYIPLHEYSSNASVDIGDSFVRIMLNSDMQAVLIENKEFAKTMKQIFEMMWKATKGEKESLY